VSASFVLEGLFGDADADAMDDAEPDNDMQIDDDENRNARPSCVETPTDFLQTELAQTCTLARGRQRRGRGP
jgi:hypothetical protein